MPLETVPLDATGRVADGDRAGRVRRAASACSSAVAMAHLRADVLGYVAAPVV